MSTLLTVPQAYSVAWDSNTKTVCFLDQAALPHVEEYRHAASVDELIAAIQSLAVRGAPAIGIAGAYGVHLIRETLQDVAERAAAVARLRAARPTAVHLAWSVDKANASFDALAAAMSIHQAQIVSDRSIAAAAAELFPEHARVVTHCHTGALATAGEGTALGAIIAAYRQGRIEHVYVDETRPLLQGARLTMWELEMAGVPCSLIIDSAAASLMAQERVDLVIVGADRIARNRDTANKIGTYALALAAAYHQLPFYVAAPENTFDTDLADGRGIVIEERRAEEVTSMGGLTLGGTSRIYNPAFDVTPGSLIRSIITEHGLR